VANNPAAVALHEARARFPGEPLECLVSLATGNAPTRALPGAGVGLQGVLGTVIGSASGVARVHECLEDTLPRGRYFRFSPEGTAFGVPIDQTERTKIEELQVPQPRPAPPRARPVRPRCAPDRLSGPPGADRLPLLRPGRRSPFLNSFLFKTNSCEGRLRRIFTSHSSPRALRRLPARSRRASERARARGTGPAAGARAGRRAEILLC